MKCFPSHLRQGCLTPSSPAAVWGIGRRLAYSPTGTAKGRGTCFVFTILLVLTHPT